MTAGIDTTRSDCVDLARGTATQAECETSCEDITTTSCVETTSPLCTAFYADATPGTCVPGFTVRHHHTANGIDTSRSDCVDLARTTATEEACETSCQDVPVTTCELTTSPLCTAFINDDDSDPGGCQAGGK